MIEVIGHVKMSTMITLAMSMATMMTTAVMDHLATITGHRRLKVAGVVAVAAVMEANMATLIITTTKAIGLMINKLWGPAYFEERCDRKWSQLNRKS